MTTDTALGTHTIPGIDEDATLPCADSDCAAPATWLLTVNCPRRHTWLFCDTHKNANVAHAAHRPTIACAACNNQQPLPQPYGTWRAL